MCNSMVLSCNLEKHARERVSKTDKTERARGTSAVEVFEKFVSVCFSKFHEEAKPLLFNIYIHIYIYIYIYIYIQVRS